MSTRQPFGGMVVHYGAPAMPAEPWVPRVAPPSDGVGTGIGTDAVRILPQPILDRLAGLPSTRRLVVSARVEDGGVRVKVTVDGVLVSESLTPGSSLTVEADV